METKPEKRNGGWVKVWRKMLEADDFTSDGLMSHVFIQVLLRASRHPGHARLNGAHIDTPPGTLLVKIRSFAELLGMSKDVLCRKLKYLHDRGTLEVKTGREGTVITVVNFASYQADETKTRHERDRDETETRHERDKRGPLQEVRTKNEEKRNNGEPVEAAQLNAAPVKPVDLFGKPLEETDPPASKPAKDPVERQYTEAATGLVFEAEYHAWSVGLDPTFSYSDANMPKNIGMAKQALKRVAKAYDCDVAGALRRLAVVLRELRDEYEQGRSKIQPFLSNVCSDSFIQRILAKHEPTAFEEAADEIGIPLIGFDATAWKDAAYADLKAKRQAEELLKAAKNQQRPALTGTVPQA